MQNKLEEKKQVFCSGSMRLYHVEHVVQIKLCMSNKNTKINPRDLQP